MEYRGLFIVSEKLNSGFNGSYCEVYLTETMERCIDDFILTPDDIVKFPDTDACIRNEINKRYSRYASCGYVPKCVSER